MPSTTRAIACSCIVAETLLPTWLPALLSPPTLRGEIGRDTVTRGESALPWRRGWSESGYVTETRPARNHGRACDWSERFRDFTAGRRGGLLSHSHRIGWRKVLLLWLLLLQ